LKARRAIETLEAAITFPIAILVMLATVNLGMVVYGQQAVQAAARQGARMGSVAQQCSACYALSAASSAINSDPIVKQAGCGYPVSWGGSREHPDCARLGEYPSFLGTLGARVAVQFFGLGGGHFFDRRVGDEYSE